MRTKSFDSYSKQTLVIVFHRLLTEGDISIDKVQLLINQSSVNQIIPGFAYLSFWIATNFNNFTNNTVYRNKQQTAYYLIHILLKKVPPILLLKGVNEINWSLKHPGWALTEVYRPILRRIKLIRYFIRSFFKDSQLYNPSSFIKFNDKAIYDKFPSIALDLESDLEYQEVCRIQVKKMLLNHVPLGEFRFVLEHRNSKNILTEAIIEILHDLTHQRNSSHSQILFAFSTIFTYIQSFTLSRDIDGQYLCEYILSMPFLSPFFLLGLLNHIPNSFYLFNLLVPQDVLEDRFDYERKIEIIRNVFPMMDMTSDHSLDEVIQSIPKLLLNYFINFPPQDNSFGEISTDSDVIINFHLRGLSVYEKMKGLVHLASVRQISPYVISSMSTGVLNCTIMSFQRTFLECCKSNTFTPILSKFFANVLSFSLPTHGDQIVSKFFDINFSNIAESEMFLRFVVLYAIHFFNNILKSSYIILYLIKALSISDNTANIARLIIIKYLRANHPILSDKAKELLLDCNDFIVLLEYIEHLSDSSRVNRAEDVQAMNNLKEKILFKMPIAYEASIPFLFHFSGSNFESFNTISQKILIMANNLIISNNPSELSGYISSLGIQGHLLLRVIASSGLIQNKLFARKCVECSIEMIKSNMELSSSYGHFAIPVNIMMFPVAQILLEKLLLLGFIEESKILFATVVQMIPTDNLALHWLIRFLPKYVNLFSQSDLYMLNQTVSRIQYSDLYYFQGSDRYKESIKSLARNEMLLDQDPDIFMREYSSPYEEAYAFAVCSILVSPDSPHTIVAELKKLVLNNEVVWENREKAAQLIGHLVSGLSSQVSRLFFSSLFESQIGNIPQYTLRVFLSFAPLPIYQEVIMNTLSQIHSDYHLLMAFIKVFLPSIYRLSGNEIIAQQIISGLLSNISRLTPNRIVDTVIDSIGWMYMSLNLNKSRMEIINSCSHLHPDIRSLIALSLDPDFGISNEDIN